MKCIIFCINLVFLMIFYSLLIASGIPTVPFNHVEFNFVFVFSLLVIFSLTLLACVNVKNCINLYFVKMFFLTLIIVLSIVFGALNKSSSPPFESEQLYITQFLLLITILGMYYSFLNLFIFD